MSGNALAFLVIILICASNQIVSKSYSNAIETKRMGNALSKVLKSLDKTVGFFEEEFDQVNLDAIFGLRITEGVLERVIKSTRKDHSSNSTIKIRHYLGNLQNRIAEVILKALPNLRTSDEKYYEQVGFVVEKKWTFLKPFTRLLVEGEARMSDRDVTTNIGNSSQPCMVALFGSEGPGYKPCNVTGRCWNIMTRLGNVGYTLTHQALYFMFGKQRGCSSLISAKLKQSNLKGGLQTMYENICRSMYHQMLILERIKQKSRQQTDLYLEQSVVCGGLLGYANFLSMARLDEMLGLQKPSGCFGNFFPETKKKEILRGTMRKILKIKCLSDGCESHITGVGSALLSIYLRWILSTQDENVVHRVKLD